VFQSRARSSLLVAALLAACAAPRDAEARDFGRTADDAKSLLSEGVHLVRRALGLERDTAVVSHAVSLSPREAAVEFELADGTTRVVSLRSGELLVNGTAVAHYRPGGTLDRAWRQLLANAAAKDTRGVLAGLRAFKVAGLSGDDLAAERRLATTFRNLIIEAPAVASVAAAARADLHGFRSDIRG